MKGKSSKYKGVSWNTKNKNWKAAITYKGEHISLGQHKQEKDAAKAYDMALIRRGKDPVNILKKHIC